MVITIIMMVVGVGSIFAYRTIKEKNQEKNKKKQIVLQSFGCGSCPSKKSCNKTDNCPSNSNISLK